MTAVGTVANDPLGCDILDTLIRENVDTSGIEVRNGTATPICVCLIGDDGNKSFIWNIAEEVAVTPETVHSALPAIRHADAILITFEPPVSTIQKAIQTAHQHGSKVVVQPAPSLVNPTDAASLPWDWIDVLIPNETEARALLPDTPRTGENLAAALAQAFAIPTVVVTLGAAGCIAHTTHGPCRYPAPETTDVIDATGASDAFAGALAAHLTAGASEPSAIRTALAAASWAIRHRGTHESMPTAAVLRNM